MSDDSPQAEAGSPLLETLIVLVGGWRRLLLVPVLAGGLAFGVASMLPKSYTAKASMLPPQPAQGGAAAALASLGSLAGLAGGAVRTPADQYAALMQSTTVVDRIIDRFELLKVYGFEYRFDVRRVLADRVAIGIGKKDGLITIEVVDRSPQRAADMANAFIDELRRMVASLAITEAQQRRLFFEKQLQTTRARLVAAQQALQASGFSAGVLRAEPRAAAEGYARLRAEITAAEVRLQALRASLADNTPEVQQTLGALSALRAQLATAETGAGDSKNPDYLNKYREFKYQETLNELFSRQYELARIDEGREGGLVQVVDAAQPPEKESGPRRLRIAAAVAVASFVLTALGLLVGRSWRRLQDSPASAEQARRLRGAWRRG